MINQKFSNIGRHKYNSGISLTEIIVTMIILGIFAALSIPNYTTTVEKSRASEGVQILEALLAAQRLFKYENGVYADGTTPEELITDLDVDIPTLKYFDPPVVDDGNDDTNPTTGELAHLDRSDLTYTLAINEIGIIICFNDTAPLCTRLGFATTF